MASMKTVKPQGSAAASGPAKFQQAKAGGGKPATKAVQKPQEPKVTAPKASATQSGPKAPAAQSGPKAPAQAK